MLSIIVPCKNEEGNVKNIFEKISYTLKDIDYEIIFIDDGSEDNTYKVLESIYNEDKKHIKVISFSRNFKKDAAIYAGLKNCMGDYACIIDGDLQQNPKYLLDMYNYLEENTDYDEVAMVQRKRKTDNFIMRVFKRMFYGLINLMSDIHFENGASDFRMFRRCVIDATLELGERNRFSKGIFSWVGFNIKYMDYDVEERMSGKTKFNFKASMNLAMEGLLSFSTKPLKISLVSGFLSLLALFVYLVVIIVKLILGMSIWEHGVMLCVILFLGGVQLITIGILGSYLAKAYLEVKGRPIYIARRKLGFDDNIL